MSQFNQLRQNVRNYCVGLTKQQILDDIKLTNETIESFVRQQCCLDKIPAYRERQKYFQEYLDELLAEQSKQ